ncbi:3-oxoadipate enol-lactonase [Micromonospora sp. WMMD1155]|uniref:3-oxoadipate enol-lactonase n=1 Tax=Micromonospora sp. WMMD1155 TaxID=3016094 RepID=UPI00249A6C55|nr:3-oxoadipate enol-lactonase [Micromonospora sp. WMMD1155]WFE54693.1 3-oxoadipate enol-lactonase [Micromonospora sp. WMMD1155]
MTVRLHLAVDGPQDAPTLLLGSSLGTAAAMWEPQIPALAERFRVVRYDHLGHGRSATPPGPYTMDLLGRELLRTLDDLDVPWVHYAGLSLGGMVGMWLAAHAPHRVRRMVLLCTSASLGPPEQWHERAATVRAAGLPTIADAVVARWFTPAFATTRPDVVAAHRAMLTAIPPDGYAACCEAIAAMDLRPALGRITAPTLVVAGADDRATPVDHAREIVGGIAGARLVVVGPAAHLANVEQPEQVGRLLLEHLHEEPGAR